MRLIDAKGLIDDMHRMAVESDKNEYNAIHRCMELVHDQKGVYPCDTVWITNKQPDRDDLYLVTDEFQNVQVRRYWTSDNTWSKGSGMVVAWSKFPEPYRG